MTMKQSALFVSSLVVAAVATAAWQGASNGAAPRPKSNIGTKPGGAGAGVPLKPGKGRELAMFAGGCFWGVEYRLRTVPGVVATAVGYSGGETDAPTYESVCRHDTGHAEAVLVEFDPAKVSYEKLLSTFWSIHNPTTLNRQGPDYGSQYRSAIFTFNEAQRKAAIASRDKEQKKLSRPIVTQIAPAQPFWIAEEYHQQYHEKTGTAACPIDKSG
jgi:peptide-methionine (S)-S-oxide reductase